MNTEHGRYESILISLSKDTAYTKPVRDAAKYALEALHAQQEREKGCGCPCGETDPNFCETCKRIRVEAIKEKLERENLKPLTLEELKERMRLGEGIYVSNTDGHLMINQHKYMAAILDKVAAFGSYGEMHIQAIYGRGLTLAQDDYERTWLAYAHKPKEPAATNAFEKEGV